MPVDVFPYFLTINLYTFMITHDSSIALSFCSPLYNIFTISTTFNYFNATGGRIPFTVNTLTSCLTMLYIYYSVLFCLNILPHVFYILI